VPPNDLHVGRHSVAEKVLRPAGVDYFSKLRALRGRLRRLIVLDGASRVVLVIVGALAAALLLDWSAKLEPQGRLVLLLAAGAATLYALWRFLVSPLLVPLGDEELALLVERKYPHLRDRLISTVQFARAGDVAPLSAAMVAALTHETLAETAPLDFQEVTTARRTALWGVGGVVALAALGLFTLCFPDSAGIFAARFFDPFSAVEWPRRTQLAVLAYDKDSRPLALEGSRIIVPKGEDLNLLVRAARHSGTLWYPPRRVSVAYTLASGSSGRRNIAMGDPAAYRTCFPTVAENFKFQATGDDASTPSYQVEIRERPRTESLRVTIRAPAYTREPERVQADGRGSVSGLAGSLVALDITTSKPIAATPSSARLLVEGEAPVPMEFVGDDAKQFRASFHLRPSQKQYAIALVDTTGLTNSPPVTYRLDVRPDRGPIVKLPEPGASKKITPKATVPIRVAAEDDYGVCRVRFLYQRGEKGQPVAHDFPASPQPTTPVEHTCEWDLTALALKERETLQVYAEAEDAYSDVAVGAGPRARPLGPNIGRSPTYSLTVISEAEMAALLQRRQQELKEQLRKLIARQEESKAGVDHLADTVSAGLDRRKATLAEREQRKIASTASTIASDLDSVVTEMKQNKVGNLEDRRRADTLAQALRQLASRDMPDAAKSIANAAEAPKAPDQAQHLASATTKQKQILDDLRAALARFDQWQDIDELLRDASELLLAQKKLNDRTADLARELLGKPADQLTPAEKGSARGLARAQEGARDSMQALETKMADVARKLPEKDPAGAKLVEQALAQASADQIRKHMDDAASRVGQAMPASALPLQKDATTALEKLVDTLNRARSPYLARDLKELQQRIRDQMEAVDKLLGRQRGHLTESQVANLRRQIKQLRAKQADTHAATTKAASPDALKQQSPAQADHARNASALTDKLDQAAMASKEHKDPLEKAGEAMKAATDQMNKANESLGNAKKEDAAKAQADALAKLDQADKHLAGLQDKLAQAKPETARLPERSKEQGETAKSTDQTAKGIEQTAKEAEKTAPSTAKALDQAKENAKNAAGSMDKAKESLDDASQKQDAGPDQQKKAEDQQNKAVDELEKAKQQLARAHDELDMRRRQQELFELEKALTALLPRQVAVREDTQKTDAATQGGEKELTHAQTLEVRDLADKQGQLHTEGADIAGRFEKENVPVFLYVMKDAVRNMADAQKRLGDRQVDWATQEAQREVERDIAQLLDALKEESRRLAQKQPPKGGGSGGGQGPSKPQPLVPPLAQLRQLKTLQAQVNEQTRAIEVDRQLPGRANPRLIQNRAARLAQKQHDLGKLSEDFAKELEKGATQEQMAPP